MFNPTKIPCLMGGEFTLNGENLGSAADLAAMFRSWADEVDDWDNKPLSEVEIVKGKIVITLKDGVFGI